MLDHMLEIVLYLCIMLCIIIIIIIIYVEIFYSCWVWRATFIFQAGSHNYISEWLSPADGVYLVVDSYCMLYGKYIHK